MRKEWRTGFWSRWLSGWLSGCPAWQKLFCWTLGVGFSTKFSQYELYFFVPLTATILCHFKWPWLGFTRSDENKTYWLLFLHTWEMIRMKFDVVLKQCKLNSLNTYLNGKLYLIKGNNLLFYFKVDMHSDVYELIWFQFGMMIDTTELHILILVYRTLTMVQGHRSAKKAKMCAPSISQFFYLFVWNLVYCWHLIVLWMCILTCQINILGREPLLVWFHKKKTTL